VRVVEVVVGAAVWVVKAVEVAEVRWSELPPRPRLVLALGLEGALGEAAAKAAASIASERPSVAWMDGAPLVAGAAFEVVPVLAAASTSARCCRLVRRPPFRRFGGCRTVRAQHLSALW
jgi:hypothetical protein